MKKWFSRKLILVVVFDVVMIALGALVPATAPMAIEAAKAVTIVYVGAQAVQNAVGIVGGTLKKDQPAPKSDFEE